MQYLLSANRIVSFGLSGSNPDIGKEKKRVGSGPYLLLFFYIFGNICRIWYRRRTFSFLISDLQNLYSPVRIWMAPHKPLRINASRAVGGVDFLFLANIRPLFRFLAFFDKKMSKMVTNHTIRHKTKIPDFPSPPILVSYGLILHKGPQDLTPGFDQRRRGRFAPSSQKHNAAYMSSKPSPYRLM